MSEMPRVYIKKDIEYPEESNATKVDILLKRINNLNGVLLSNYTKIKFEYYLEQLLEFVTLIGWEITPSYYNLETQRIEDILIYYYNEDMMKILVIIQLIFLYVYGIYKFSCAVM